MKCLGELASADLTTLLELELFTEYSFSLQNNLKCIHIHGVSGKKCSEEIGRELGGMYSFFFFVCVQLCPF